MPSYGISFFLQQKKETKNAAAANSLRVCFRAQGKEPNSSPHFTRSLKQRFFLFLAYSSILIPQVI
jgi:hypothetical protein